MDKTIRKVHRDAPEDYTPIVALSAAECFELLEELNQQVYFFATRKKNEKMNRQVVNAGIAGIGVNPENSKY